MNTPDTTDWARLGPFIGPYDSTRRYEVSDLVLCFGYLWQLQLDGWTAIAIDASDDDGASAVSESSDGRAGPED